MKISLKSLKVCFLSVVSVINTPALSRAESFNPVYSAGSYHVVCSGYLRDPQNANHRKIDIDEVVPFTLNAYDPSNPVYSKNYNFRISSSDYSALSSIRVGLSWAPKGLRQHMVTFNSIFRTSNDPTLGHETSASSVDTSPFATGVEGMINQSLPLVISKNTYQDIGGSVVGCKVCPPFVKSCTLSQKNMIDAIGSNFQIEQ